MIIAIILMSVILSISATAQDQAQSTGSAAQPEAEVTTEGTVTQEQPEVAEGVARGAFYWADPDPVAIQVLLDFGIDIVSIRLGKPDVMRSPTTPDNALDYLDLFSWSEGGDYSFIAYLPQSMQYRLVVEIDPDFFGQYNEGSLVDWLSRDIKTNLDTIPDNISSFEIYFPDIPDTDKVDSLLTASETSDPGFNIELGFDGALLASLPRSFFEEVGANVDGFVVYFINTDFTGLSPKITDRSWIDYTVSELELIGVPYTAVLPIYNRAVLFPGGRTSEAVDLPPFDLENMSIFGTPRQLGAAGIEFTIDESVEIGGFSFSQGDKIRILESLKEFDLKTAIEEISATTLNLKEISLFRFPLVPGFDPSANQALTAAGWMAGSRESQFDPEEAEKDQLDQKQDKGSQIIMMITLGLMMFLMMRMMSRGKAKSSEGSNGGGSSK